MKKTEPRNRPFASRAAKTVTFALLVFVLASCCKECETPTPEPEKFAVMFGVDNGEGELKATVGETPLVSPARVEKGQKVVFNATHSKAWQIHYWKKNGEIIRSIEPRQEFEIGADLDIRVAFKPWESETSEK